MILCLLCTGRRMDESIRVLRSCLVSKYYVRVPVHLQAQYFFRQQDEGLLLDLREPCINNNAEGDVFTVFICVDLVVSSSFPSLIIHYRLNECCNSS